MERFGIFALFCVASALPRTDPRFMDNRIVGGIDVLIGDAPYQISLQSYSSHICGGSIIDKNIIITAAHCVYGSSPTGYTVRVGSTYRNEGGEVIPVSDIIWNKNFSYVTLDYDVALLKLKNDIQFSDNASPIKLLDANAELEEGSISVITGWGAVKEGGGIPDQLQMVLVPTVSEAVCKEAYEPGHKITKNMMCAGKLNTGGIDACQGDSGGPLAVRGKLAGIVSWGLGCARPGYPGVYSSVAALRGWIDENVQKLRRKNNKVVNLDLLREQNL